MGTAEWRSAKSPAFFTRGDYMPGMKVSHYVVGTGWGSCQGRAALW